MERLRGFPRRFRFPHRPSAQIRRDVDDELAFHFAAKIDALQQQGLTFEQAREEALRQFGDVEAARKQLVTDDRRSERQSLWLTMLDDTVRDARLAWRSLWRTPGFTVVAILVLALGIGTVSGAFNLLNVLALKPVMMAAPEKVVSVLAVQVEGSKSRAFSYSEYTELRERVERISSLAAFSIADTGIEERGITRRAQTSPVSANYFETFGVPLAQGRAFTLAEERGEDPPVAVISYDIWLRSGADPGVLGSIIRVNGQPLTVVGIAPRGFTGTTALIAVDVWVPLASMERIERAPDGEAPRLADPRSHSLLLFGRLAERASAIDAETELAALAATSDANLPDSSGDRYTYVAGEMGRLSISTGPNPDEGLVRDMLLPTAMSAVVLLIACLNLANMFLARGASRHTEMAIRQSLGCGRVRLMRQVLTEGMILAALGGLAGLIWSYWGTSWVAASFIEAVPLGLTIVIDTRPDLRVAFVTAGACIAATLLFGLGPAWRVTGTDVLSGLKASAGSAPLARGRSRTRFSGRSLMLIAQIALSLVMLTAGGLFVRSALFAANAVPAFDLDLVLVAELDASLVGWSDVRARTAYVDVVERLRALPGVEHAGLSSQVPFSGISFDMTSIRPAGLPPDAAAYSALQTTVSEGYFDGLGLPMLRGRDFTSAEITSETSPRVAIIGEPLARRLFGDADAIGRQIQYASRSSPDAEPVVMEIVGVAAGNPGPGFEPTPSSHLYVPLAQAYRPSMNVLIGVSDLVADPASLLETIRDEIRAVDPALPVLTLTTLREIRDDHWQLWLTRIGGQLFTLLGVLALFVAMVGLYGVKAFLISRRTREIGVRMALGATRGAVLKQLMRESMTLTVAGLVVGVVLAIAVGRVLSSLLYGVSSADPWALLGATALLALTAAFSSWLPISRALRIEPSAALRHE